MAHLTKEQEVLETLLDTPHRDRQDLDLWITLASALHSVKGQAAPEVERANTRAREPCRQVEDVSQLFRVLLGLHKFYGRRMRNQAALELLDQLYNLVRRTQDPDLMLEAHMARGTMLGIHASRCRTSGSPPSCR
jgi:hypothetical protein